MRRTPFLVKSNGYAIENPNFSNIAAAPPVCKYVIKALAASVFGELFRTETG
jgi:hypothetical protein